MSTDMRLRPPDESDFDVWSDLFAQYCRFYGTDATETKSRTVWSWLLDPGHSLEGLLLVSDGEVVGLCHFRQTPESLAGAHAGFLEDLFVAPAHRGSGAAEFVIRELVDLAQRRGWVGLSWLTADTNYRARSVYDRVARRASWITYEAVLPPDGGR